MKEFFIYVLKIIFLIIVSAYLFDFGYTYIYSQSHNRNKIDNVINCDSLKYDVVILGSSRANNHFATEMFEEKGIKSYNYGMSGARLQESSLLLQLMIERKFKIKNIILEVDLNINSEGYSEGTRARFMPFLHSSKIIADFYRNKIDDFNLLYYLPFYRYIKYGSVIGLREMFFVGMKKKSALVANLGFYPLLNQGNNMSYDLSKLSPKRNRDYENIKIICKQNNINLISVSTPMCSNVLGINYFDKIKEIYPEVRNFENVVPDDKYFSSCGHMNIEGAKIFTSKIINEFF